ncbi:MAG: thiamine pyrophosphate-dependent enzyme [Clostridiales Family XIII bacterium]|nr:thiamine pyrophosphate-dependent enzyme [Clostridia bacterium]MDY3010950.1 thiamine pyrophosphate-dependent enzyme [Clostridiales Family XIII bacterium]
MNKLYKKYIKTELLPTLFCPGCGNGIIQYAAIDAIDKLGIKEEVACVSGIGCSSWIPCYYKLDVMHTMHGRALAFAQGLKLAQPDKKILVFTGDGDCLAIGGNHLLHASARNIDLTVVMANNYIYGMTGGQKSPSTPKGSITKTTPFGSIDEPIDGCKLAMTMGASYVARWTTAHPVQLAKAIREGMEHCGFSFIEVLCQCPVQAGKGVYGEKEPAKILKYYREKTDSYKEGKEIAEGKIPIGTLKYDKNAEEYIQKVNQKLISQGIKRG